MTTARKEQVALEATPFYHCYVRCVRRAFLCGDDHLTGENYDYRKQWIVSRIKFLSYVYAIDICAYAVMSNHYHVVLHVDKQRALNWSMQEVAERWLQLYKGNLLVDRWLAKPETISEAEMEKIAECIEQWRERLYDIGWFMRGVNEKIARMANEEENCKGRFWEGRYKSQALLDQAALLSCMAYVDLNPVRAGIADSLENSDFTAIQQRLAEYAQTHVVDRAEALTANVQKQKDLEEELGLHEQAQAPLMPFDGSAHTPVDWALPFTQEDYFDLVDKTGRAIREGKRGFIAADAPPVIQRLGINPDKWVSHVKNFGRNFSIGIGQEKRMQAFAHLLQIGLGKGVRQSRLLFNGQCAFSNTSGVWR